MTFTSLIKAYHLKNLKTTRYSFYQNLAAVYRYKHGETQLEFVWDGRDHSQIYKSEWVASIQCVDNPFLHTRIISASCAGP
jgi:hypothetical protein